jgi:hypothetical protein
VTAPDGYQLSRFFGRDGDEIDRLGAIWTSIDVVQASATEAPEVADEDIQLSALFGGPHGTAFSDINTLVLGQTVEGVTVRGDKRVDAVTLHVTEPAEAYMVHGGTGGSDSTLLLEAGEYINSIEAHWDKKNDHTRAFYLNLGTNVGNSVSAGTQTDNKGAAIAPAMRSINWAPFGRGSAPRGVSDGRLGNRPRLRFRVRLRYLQPLDPQLGGPHDRRPYRQGLLPEDRGL